MLTEREPKKWRVGDSVRRGLGLQVRRGGGLLLAEDAIEEALERTTRPRAPAKTGNSKIITSQGYH